MQLDAHFIAPILKNASFHNDSFSINTSVSVDTRTLQKGDIFVALQGEHVDGHDFIQQALERGASGFILAHAKKDFLLKKFGDKLFEKQLLFVQDTTKALIDLATHWRSQFNYPVVAITGSVGKTTTKEMVHNILKLTKQPFLVSSGNQNTLIGVSLNMLKMKPEHHVAVFEIGIGKKGAMKDLAKLLRPTYGLITKIGHGHLQGLGNLSSISHEKRELFSFFTLDQIGVINGDQKELTSLSYHHPIIRFGYKTSNHIQARKVKIQQNITSFIAKIYHQKYPVILQGCNHARVENALAAISIGHLLKIPHEILIKGIEQSITIEGRFQIIPHASGSIFINDSYNANPESMKASLLAFQAYQTNLPKIVVIGDMLELGKDTSFWHRQLGKLLNNITHLSFVILIGDQVQATKKTLSLGIKSKHFMTVDQATIFLKDMLLEKNALFLFKGSHSVGLSDLVTKL